MTVSYQTIFQDACHWGPYWKVAALLKEPSVDPIANDNIALKWASLCGHKATVP